MLLCCSVLDEDENEQLQTVARQAPAPRYARLGKRQVSPSAADDDDADHPLTLSQRAVPTNFRFAGIGKRRVSLAYKAAGLGKRGPDSWDDPVYDDYARPESDKRRVSTAMRYAGIGKRRQSRIDAAVRYAGIGPGDMP